MPSDADTYETRLAHLRGCGVPELEAEYIAKALPPGPTTDAVQAFARGPGTFCLLTGGPGSGKTTAAVSALLRCRVAWGQGEWCYSPSEARFVVASDLARMSYFDAEAQRRLGRLERVPWLVLDDLGSELLTDGWKSNLSEIVMQRHSNRRKTLITTNLSPKAFAERYDSRILSRIEGSGVVVATGRMDHRVGAERGAA